MRCTAYAIMKCKLLLSLLIILTIQCVQSEDSAHWVVKGDPTDTTTRAKPDECVSDTNSYGSTYNSYGNNIGASCCDSAGTTAYTPTDCTASVSVTFSEAETICNDAGYRLCTQAEMNGAISGGGLGCNFDFYHIWTSDECSLSDDGPTITVYVEETNTCDGEPTYYEWQKVVSCRETLSDSNDESIFTFYADWDDDDVRESIVANAASIKFAPTDDMNNEDYVVFAKENTGSGWPVYYLRRDDDVSTSFSKWCGTDTALQRVGQSYNYGYDLGRLIYGDPSPSSSDEIQIYLDDNNCAWDWGTSVGKDIDVYIGYSVDLGIDITITACSTWSQVSTSNTLQMLLKGSSGSTKFFYVNENEALPTNGGSTTFSLQMDDLGANIGDLYSVMLSMDDTDGFCLAGISLSYFNIDGLNDVNIEFASDYFGNGVILRKSCPYSFQYLSSDIPLLQCFETFDLNAYAQRGIFETDIHTCIGDDSGISAANMAGTLYAVIMGKESTESGDSYHSTSITYLDHFVGGMDIGNSGSLDAELQYLGHLIESNTYMPNSATDLMYSSVSGTVIGVKIETVDSNDVLTQTDSDNSDFHLQVDGEIIGDSSNEQVSYSILDDGRYIVVYFKSSYRRAITTDTELYIYNEDTDLDNIEVNIYIIFDGFEEEYRLPFRVGEVDTAISWSEANDLCKEQYGSTLVSIQSMNENILINGHLKGNNAWFGYIESSYSNDVWEWTDGAAVSFTNWASGEPNNNDEECGQFKGGGTWNDLRCTDTEKRYVCNSPLWPPNVNRLFEFNSEQYMDNVTLIAVGNIHEEDTLCIDAINVNDNAAIYLSNYYIGNTADADSTLLTAFFQYPVCATTVVGMTVDYDSEAANMINGASTISGLQCKNNNKLISSTCSIAQSFTMSKTTSYSISNEDSSTNEYSWGSATSIMKGITESESSTVTNDFSFGFEESISAGISGGLFVEASLEVSLSANQQWTRSEENSQATDVTVESTTEQNEGNTESTTATSSYESTFESTTETTIECAAEIEVPPLHAVTYSMVFNTFNTTINTWTDLKLTLCSAFFNDIGEDDDSHVVYIDNIPGVIAHKETTSCTVEFEPSEYLRNDLPCIEVQQLAVSMGSTYVPRCQSTNNTQYDGCQCDVDGAGSCWCVDDNGNVIDGKAMSLHDVFWENACTSTDYLNCDTELNAGVNVFVKPDAIDEHYNFGKYYDNGLLLLVSAIVMAVFFCGYCLYHQLKNIDSKIQNLSTKNKHLKSYQSEVDAEEAPLI